MKVSSFFVFFLFFSCIRTRLHSVNIRCRLEVYYYFTIEIAFFFKGLEIILTSFKTGGKFGTGSGRVTFPYANVIYKVPYLSLFRQSF